MVIAACPSPRTSDIQRARVSADGCAKRRRSRDLNAVGVIASPTNACDVQLSSHSHDAGRHVDRIIAHIHTVVGATAGITASARDKQGASRL